MTIHKSTFVNMLYSREFLVEGQFQPKTFAKLVCVGKDQVLHGLGPGCNRRLYENAHGLIIRWRAAC